MTANALQLQPTRCAICGTLDNADELYAANFDAAAFNPAIFSARRLPDRIHARIVKCRTCGLVRSDPVADAASLAELYAQSSFDYGDEVPSLQRTYGKYLAQLPRWGTKKNALLEIGCGNGFMLQEALRQGYRDARGVEPGRAAVQKAKPRVRDKIVCDVMREGLFAPESFDVACLFQVFDHIADPVALLGECRKVLRPGGLIVFLQHNVEAVSARMLGERSPIIDLEHTYLYSPATLSRLVEAHGFRVRHTAAVWNNYPLHYLLRLLPMPDAVKRPLLNNLKPTALGKLRLSVPLGNLFLVAQRT